MANTETKLFYQKIQTGEFEIIVDDESIARRIACELYEGEFTTPADVDEHTVSFLVDLLHRVHGTPFLPAGTLPNNIPAHMLGILSQNDKAYQMLNAIYTVDGSISQNGVLEPSIPPVQPVNFLPENPAKVLV